MKKVRNTKAQLMLERRRNDALQDKLSQLQANMDYVAMMSDIDLGDEGEPVANAPEEANGGEEDAQQ